ncbi:MAG: hypothetical protein A3F43_00590 [Gammaproteobacteria bacterium RIFCSPHIGHO2_12_FULL_42_10]|nr:MAG: hypothetical protein A3F43_00590 [Gammaproteobacteria bacterium RIFCSPHIGHO2_12_FULL_42_10]
MFMFHAAFALGLIALTASTALLMWSKHLYGAGAGFAKVIAMLVIIFSIASVICTLACGFKYWQQGYFQSFMQARQMMPAHSQIMMESKHPHHSQ